MVLFEAGGGVLAHTDTPGHMRRRAPASPRGGPRSSDRIRLDGRGRAQKTPVEIVDKLNKKINAGVRYRRKRTRYAQVEHFRLYALPRKRRLTLNVAARVTRMGRAEPQTRRVSHERS
jgi:hypothetical protein